ncbi:MAG: dienelactone hydrolase family protein [Telluria sp.]
MRLFLFVVLCAVAPLGLCQATLNLTPAPGRHAVGVKVVQQYDYSRSMNPEVDVFGKSKHGPRARPMQTLAWYPAQASMAKPVTLLDYIQAGLAEDDFSLGADELRKASARWIKHPRQPAAQTMLAVRDARPAAGTFPVVVYAPSFASSADENADLCEYLASHGYIVLSTGSRGARYKTMTDDLEGIEAQAADIAFLVAYAQTLPGADTSRTAAVGFSWGGISNVVAAARTNRIHALVSLDGSIRSYPHLLAPAKALTPANTAVPMLSIGKRPETRERLLESDTATTVSYLNRMKYSNVYLATMHPMDHGHFAGRMLRTAGDGDFNDFTREEVAAAYKWTVRYVTEFLDAHLKKDAGALAFLKQSPTANGAPRHLMSFEARPAKALAPTPEAFIAEFNRGGFKGAQPIYESMRANEASFSLSPMKLNLWGYELIAAKKPEAAVELFKLAIFIEPQWGGVHDSLGEAYEAIGDTPKAIKAYEDAVAIDPTLESSNRRLEILRQKRS